jgi:peptide/nickel transport system permease protein
VTGLVVRRAMFALLTLLATSAIVFVATEILPGDVAHAILGQSATPELLQNLRLELGLDRPPIQRYFEWLGGFLSGDLGKSLASRAAVMDIVLPRLWNTVMLAAYAATVAIPLSIGLGILAAAKADGPLDRLMSTLSIFIVSIPEFAIALILVVVLAVQAHWFPAVIYRPDWANPINAVWQLFLPMLTLLCTMMAHMIRMTRAAMLDVMASGYVEFALLKGVPKGRLLMKHALPNAMGPVLSVIALNLGYLISGVAVVEVVFAYPGLGRLMVDSIFYRDVPLIQATAMIFCVLYILCNFVADLSTVVFNPKIMHAS